MNKWLVIFLAGFVAPFIIVWMFVRHPVLVWKEFKHSFNLCMRGKDGI